MMTNSAKYGALADSTGQVEVAWRLDHGVGLIIEWKESGGPPVQPPSRRGFGTTHHRALDSVRSQGRRRNSLRSARRAGAVRDPGQFCRADAAVAKPSRRDEGKPRRRELTGTALIVEDNLIIAMSAEVILLELGARHVETAASVDRGAEVDRADAAEFRAARPQPRQREQHHGRQEAEGDRSALHLRDRLRRARADSRRTRRRAGVQKPYTREMIERALTHLVPAEPGM